MMMMMMTMTYQQHKWSATAAISLSSWCYWASFPGGQLRLSDCSIAHCHKLSTQHRNEMLFQHQQSTLEMMTHGIWQNGDVYGLLQSECYTHISDKYVSQDCPV